MVKAIKNKRSTSNNRQIPVIFITGYANEEIEKEANTLNPAAFLYKPFDIPELINKVKEVLKVS